MGAEKLRSLTKNISRNLTARCLREDTKLQALHRSPSRSLLPEDVQQIKGSGFAFENAGIFSSENLPRELSDGGGRERYAHGSSVQLDNLLAADGTSKGASPLGRSVTKTFNNEVLLEPFDLIRQRGVPLTLSLALTLSPTVEGTDYFGNICLMQFNSNDVGTYLDRGIFVFGVVLGRIGREPTTDCTWCTSGRYQRDSRRELWQGEPNQIQEF